MTSSASPFDWSGTKWDNLNPVLDGIMDEMQLILSERMKQFPPLEGYEVVVEYLASGGEPLDFTSDDVELKVRVRYKKLPERAVLDG